MPQQHAEKRTKLSGPFSFSLMAERGKVNFPFLHIGRGKKAHWGLLPLCTGVDACRNGSKLALQAGKQNVKISSIAGVWTKELGGAASLKHLFFSPSAPLLADRKEYKSLSWKHFGGAVSELKDWLVLLFSGRQRCGRYDISHSPRPPPPNLGQLCILQGRCGEQAPMWLCGGPALLGRDSYLKCQVSGHRASIQP